MVAGRGIASDEEGDFLAKVGQLDEPPEAFLGSDPSEPKDCAGIQFLARDRVRRRYGAATDDAGWLAQQSREFRLLEFVLADDQIGPSQPDSVERAFEYSAQVGERRVAVCV